MPRAIYSGSRGGRRRRRVPQILSPELERYARIGYQDYMRSHVLPRIPGALQRLRYSSRFRGYRLSGRHFAPAA